MWKYLRETKRAGLEEKKQYIFKHYKLFACISIDGELNYKKKFTSQLYYR